MRLSGGGRGRPGRTEGRWMVNCLCAGSRVPIMVIGVAASASAKPDASAQPDDFDCERASEAIVLNRHRLLATV
jgi:hypothetical protein